MEASAKKRLLSARAYHDKDPEQEQQKNNRGGSHKAEKHGSF
jgi:hypothetical protein